MMLPNTRPRRGVPRYVHLTPGWSPCYECGGDGACVVCDGSGKDDGRPCTACGATGLCSLCDGAGQLAPQKKMLEFVGFFRELGFDDHPEYPSIADFRGRRPQSHKAEVVAYLGAGKPMVVSPGGKGTDVFDASRRTTSRSILTDGRFAWSRELAYYVENYDLGLPAHFEQHMAEQGYRLPDVDTSKLTLRR